MQVWLLSGSALISENIPVPQVWLLSGSALISEDIPVPQVWLLSGSALISENIPASKRRDCIAWCRIVKLELDPVGWCLRLAVVSKASSAQGASTPGGKSHGTPPTSLATRSATMFSKSSSVGGAKRNKDKRRSSRGKAERDSNPQTPQSTAVTPTTTTTTQWYMASPLPADTDRITWAVGTPVFELRQENGPTKNGTCLSLARGQLTPKRPLRSEVERERRLSRPSCGQFPPTRLSTTGANMTTARFNGSSSNRDSIGTTDSTASEEDGAPPPLPQKTREADYCNLPDDAERESESIRAPATPRIRNKPPPPPEPLEGSTPPHPPPKKPPLKPSTS
uniref:Uncharacterized protein n=1 Tax=Timema cristinae TaxID=61476 RepID=A0A7R9GRY8_TIMCR|nr:unnamed protein product [Timema cristinae]